MGVVTIVCSIITLVINPRLVQSQSVTQVTPFNCTTNSGPLQTIWASPDYIVNERTLQGNRTVFTIPRSRTSPSWQRINACGINPIDNILYCIIEIIDGSTFNYLVRIDASRVEFVAKLPCWSFAGDFSSDGTFYFPNHDGTAEYYKVADAAKLTGYANQSASGLKDHSSSSPIVRKIGGGADMVVVTADLEGSGKNSDYIMTLYDSGKLNVIKVSGTVKNWVLQSQPALPVGSNKSYGAGWNYQNRVFFSQNGAGGLYEVLLSSIDLLEGTVVLQNVGPSFPAGATDGMNCINTKVQEHWSAQCGSKVGAYSAITSDQPVPPHGAKNVRANQELMFYPSHDATVTGYQVFLGPATLNPDGSVASVEWHLTCNLPCGANVCRPPFGLDNSLGGHFAWRVDMLKLDGTTVAGTVWQFSLMTTITYSTRAVGDTYIQKQDFKTKKYLNYGGKRHMLMWSRNTSNPRFGFVKFNVLPPTYAGVGDCAAKLNVVSASLRLTVLSFSMHDVSVYRIPAGEDDFDEFNVTSEDGKHPGAAYPNVFKDSVLVKKEYGPIAPKSSFTIDVTGAVVEVLASGGVRIAFGLETSTKISRFCSYSTISNQRPGVVSWCYPKLEIVAGINNCPKTAKDLSCSKPTGSTPGSLDAMCGSTPPTFPGTPPITDWRDDTVITTTTTTTTTTMAPPIREGHCRYNDHVTCSWPHSDIMCSGDQCCPDGSTCPSSQFAQAQGCNLKKYDCTAFVPANWTCREAEVVLCPGTDITCSGDTCCPNNSTCPSASVMQAPSCGPKSIDCQAPLSANFSCAIGEFVQCPGSSDRCTGNQCCPDGSTCPSAPLAVAEGCGPKKATCEMLEWNVNLRVRGIVFANVPEDAKEEVTILAKEALAHAGTVPSGNVGVSLKAGSLIVNAKIGAPGGWSQKRLDNSVTSNILSEETRIGMEELLADVDGLKQASSGDEMVFEQIKAERADEVTSTTPSPSATTSFRGAETESTTTGVQSEVASSAAPLSLLPALLVTFITMC